MSWLVAALGVAVAALGVLVVGLLRSHAEILRALHDLGVEMNPDAGAEGSTFAAGGRAAPPPASPGGEVAAVRPGALGAAHDLMGVTPTGEAVALSLAGDERPTLLAFLSSGCTTCLDFWDGLARDGRRPAGLDVRLVVVTHGEQRESPPAVAKLAAPGMDVIMSSEAFEDYDVAVAPYFVLVDGRARRIVGEGAARTHQQLRELIAKAAADAGVPVSGGRPSRRQFLGGAARAARVDRELAAAGITPGHPSLNPETPDAPPQGSVEPGSDPGPGPGA